MGILSIKFPSSITSIPSTAYQLTNLLSNYSFFTVTVNFVARIVYSEATVGISLVEYFCISIKLKRKALLGTTKKTKIWSSLFSLLGSGFAFSIPAQTKMLFTLLMDLTRRKICHSSVVWNYHFAVFGNNQKEKQTNYGNRVEFVGNKKYLKSKIFTWNPSNPSTKNFMNISCLCKTCFGNCQRQKYLKTRLWRRKNKSWNNKQTAG